MYATPAWARPRSTVPFSSASRFRTDPRLVDELDSQLRQQLGVTPDERFAERAERARSVPLSRSELLENACTISARLRSQDSSQGIDKTNAMERQVARCHETGYALLPFAHAGVKGLSITVSQLVTISTVTRR